MLSYTLRFLAVVLFIVAFGFPGLATNEVRIAATLFVTLSALVAASLFAARTSPE